MIRYVHSFNSGQFDWTAFFEPIALPPDQGVLAPSPPAVPDLHPQQITPAAAAGEDQGDDGVIMLDMTGDMDADEAGSYLMAALTGATTMKSVTATGASTSLITTYTSGATGRYNVTVTFTGVTATSNGGWTSALQNTFVAAANRISAMITGDVPDVTVNGRKVDDISITASLTTIDGVGGILGQAGPTALRSASLLPATATMQFDTADAQTYQAAGLFDEIVTHEMLHSIGFGTIWSYKGLTSGMNFIGKNTVAAYNKLVTQYASTHRASLVLADGVTLKKDLVPLETQGGSGTAGAHWAENVFNTELMTGYIDTKAVNGSAIDPLSAMTIASLKDLGYATAASAPADSYKLV